MQYQNLQIRYIVDQTPRDTGSDHVALRGLAHHRHYASHEDNQTISGKLVAYASWCEGKKGEADGEEE